MTTTTLDAARAYLDTGWSPIPLPAGKKWPPPNGVTGWNGRYTKTSDLGRADWDWSGNIALRLPVDVVGIDIDVYHGGDASLAELESRLGALPPTTWSTSRDDGSGIALFRVPANTTLRTDPAEGIDIVQFHHRYAVCAPSIHPDTGKQYRWIDEQAEEEVEGPGDIDDLPALPWAWIEELAAIDKTGAANAVTPDDAEHFIAAHTEQRRPAAIKGLRQKLINVKPGGRHDALVTNACWAMREAAAGLYTAAEAIAVLHGWWIDIMSGDPRRREGGEFGAAILWAIGQAEADTERVAKIREDSVVVHVEEPALDADRDTGEIRPDNWKNLSDDFWRSRPSLTHIRQAAHARARSADAVLLFTMARVAVQLPPNIMLPPISGSAASLNFLGAVVGTSGAGKSTSGGVARELMPIERRDLLIDLPLGSGEGIVERFFEWVMEEQASGKDKKVKRQTKSGMYLHLDEGQALGEMGSRKGSTLMPTLRSGWSGETLGQANASDETFRVLPQHNYRLAVTVGFQAEYADRMVADGVAGGDPQRFVFASAVDPNVPRSRTPWPGAIAIDVPPAGAQRHVDVDDTVADEVYARNVLATQGVIELEPLDSHRDLVRLKVATYLAVLDGRLNVSVEDWALAEDVMRASAAVRQWVLEVGRARTRSDAESRIVQVVARERAVRTDSERAALESGARSMARRAHKLGGVLSKRDLLAAVASKHKQAASSDDMVERAETEGWIVAVPDGWRAGESKPS